LFKDFGKECAPYTHTHTTISLGVLVPLLSDILLPTGLLNHPEKKNETNWGNYITIDIRVINLVYDTFSYKAISINEASYQ